MSDIIYIRELKAETIIGVYPWEQQVKQLIVLDLDLICDITKAARSGLIADTIDYAALSKRVINYIEAKKFVLLETLIEEIADLILKEFTVLGLKITASKPGAVAGAKDIGIILERSKP